MKNTGKRIITTLLAIMMTITALLGNGIEARANDHLVGYDTLANCAFEIGEVISTERWQGCYLKICDGNDPNLSVTINMGSGERHILQASYSDGKGNTIRTNAKWICTFHGASNLDLRGERYIPQTEEKKPESTPPKEVTNQPNVEDQPEIAEVPEEVHLCNMEWVTTKEPSVGEDGEECYRCSFCGRTEQKMPIPGAVAYVKDLYGFIKDAAENGLVTYDAKTNTAISDYILHKMAERRDVTTVISFEYKGEKYQITFSPEADYDALLNDEEQFYGYLGLSGYKGITVEKLSAF